MCTFLSYYLSIYLSREDCSCPVAVSWVIRVMSAVLKWCVLTRALAEKLSPNAAVLLLSGLFDTCVQCHSVRMECVDVDSVIARAWSV